MKKALLILMIFVTIGIGSQDPMVEKARAALKEAGSILPAELRHSLSSEEINWALHYADNLDPGRTLVVMSKFGYGAKDGYTAYIQLSSWQKLFAVMYFAELMVRSTDVSATALMMKANVYTEFLGCSNNLAGKLAQITPKSIQKLCQELRQEEEEELRRFREEREEKTRKEEEAVRERAKVRRRNDSLYVQDVAQRAVKTKTCPTFNELKEAEKLCYSYAWDVPDVIIKRIRKKKWCDGWWDRNWFCVGASCGVVLGLGLIGLLSLCES